MRRVCAMIRRSTRSPRSIARLEDPCPNAARASFARTRPQVAVSTPKSNGSTPARVLDSSRRTMDRKMRFLPMAVLRRAGYEDVREGASITCEIGAGAKGPLVTNVLNVDDSTALSSPSGAGGADRGPRPATTIEGAVKWFEPEKGYGFISPRRRGQGRIHPHHPRCAAAASAPSTRVNGSGSRWSMAKRGWRPSASP